MATAQPQAKAPPTVSKPPGKTGRRPHSLKKLNPRDRRTLILMAVIPTILVVGLVWLPAIGSVVLSFTNWDGIGDLSDIQFIGLRNYTDIVTIYPPFWPAVKNNLLWLLSLFLIFTPLGMFLAVLVDRELKGSRLYQTSFYLPVVLAGALVGFIWQLLYSRDLGLINAVFETEIGRAHV